MWVNSYSTIARLKAIFLRKTTQTYGFYYLETFSVVAKNDIYASSYRASPLSSLDFTPVGSEE